MQLYQVTDHGGELIMRAPMATISKCFVLDPLILTHILKATRKLGFEYWVHRVHPQDGWPATLRISRLPLEIPHPSHDAGEPWEAVEVLDLGGTSE